MEDFDPMMVLNENLRDHWSCTVHSPRPWMSELNLNVNPSSMYNSSLHQSGGLTNWDCNPWSHASSVRVHHDGWLTLTVYPSSSSGSNQLSSAAFCRFVVSVWDKTESPVSVWGVFLVVCSCRVSRPFGGLEDSLSGFTALLFVLDQHLQKNLSAGRIKKLVRAWRNAFLNWARIWENFLIH